ncbi:MAG: pyridoxal phosphate-dependent aminotransferase [Candidatus Micrarchaeia archaeon]
MSKNAIDSKKLISKIHFISERISDLPHSIFSKFIGLKGKNIISLGPGEPDFETPKHIKEAAKKALDDNYTHYAPTEGYPDLLEEIGKKLRRKNNIKLDDPTKQICVTAGSTESLLLSMLCSFDSTEKVLIPNPGFATYGPTLETVDVVPVPYYLFEDDGFELNLDDIKKKITPKTKGIIINSPSNPTGSVFSKSKLEELADIAVEHNLTIISDEAYEDLVFNGKKHFSIASLNGMEEYVLSNFTFSKSYAMAGFRIGYVVGHEKLISQMSKIHLYTSVSASSISQRAALAALKGPQSCIKEMVTEYDRRRKFIVKRINEIKGFELKKIPEGAFYIFPKIRFDELEKYPYKDGSSEKFSLWLLDKIKVITIPGIEFGYNGEGFIRISYATNLKMIEEAMDRFEKLLGSK